MGLSLDFRAPIIVFFQIHLTRLNPGLYYQLITTVITFEKQMLQIQARAACPSASCNNARSADEQIVNNNEERYSM